MPSAVNSLLLIALLSLSACTTSVPKPAEVGDVQGSFSVTGGAPLLSNWWESLPDPELHRLEMIVLAENPDRRGFYRPELSHSCTLLPQ